MKKQNFNKNWTLNGQSVTLPHDAMIHEERRADAPGGSGHAYFPGGVYEYEKTFEVSEDQIGKPMLLHFEGVYRNASVSVNGNEACSCAYGYIPFTADLTDLVREGENTVKVTADNSELPNSRWYSGSGIYRPVWLVTSEKDHICFEGVRVDTLSVNPARIRIRTRVEGEGTVQVSVLDAEGSKAAQGMGCDIILEIPGAALWSDESPYLYRAQVSLIKEGAVVDEETVSFGIRLISWSSRGLFINGKETLLRGGCVHHDNGILGAACFDESEYRKARILKESGFNALRISHNPASRALLEACDALGLYVMDETWDMWYSHKTLYDYAGYFMDNWKEDLTKLISRDYNHPSVIMYSIGNEISEPATEKGVSLAKEMIDLIHEKDPGRPAAGGINLMIITRSAAGKAIYNEDGSGRADEKKDESSSGMNSTMFNLMASMVGTGMNRAANGKKADRITSPVLDALDIAGYNYASGRYMGEGKLHPDRVIVGSETFPQDIYKNWQMVKKLPYLVGDFMWTAWDYLGECGIGAWAYTDDGRGFDKPYPWILADTGALDILGTPNGELFLAQSAWGLLKNPRIGVRPVNHPGVKVAKSIWRGTNAMESWSFKGCTGEKAVVEVYSEAPYVALFVNGFRIGKKKTRGGKALFTAKYQPGNIVAAAFDEKGKEIGRASLHSAGKAALAVRHEKEKAAPGEILYIPVQVEDRRGIVECNDDRKVTVTVEGGELLAFGSANPRTEERYDSGTFTTYYGRALAVVRAGESGTVRITAEGGEKAQAEIPVI